MSFETPEVIDQEMIQVEIMKKEKEALDELRLEQKAARKRKAKANRKK